MMVATTRTIFGAGVAVPTLSPAALALLTLLLAAVGLLAAGRRGWVAGLSTDVTCVAPVLIVRRF